MIIDVYNNNIDIMPKGYNRKHKKRNKRSPHKRGLKIGCINVNGLVNSPTKRIDLNNWIHLHDLDVVCIHKDPCSPFTPLISRSDTHL